METTAPDQFTAFRRLYGYITGDNEGDESIPTTAPVATRDGASIPMTAPVRSRRAGEGDRLAMAFFLPERYDLETAPQPTDPDVRLVGEPPRTVAVERFSWYAPGWRVRRKERALLETLANHDRETRGEPFLLRYDAPMTPPFLRRNEVAVELIPAR